MSSEKHRYDLIVIGAGAAGEAGATSAADLGKNVALVEKADLGGATANTGTLPSKTLRETALYLSGLEQRGLYGIDYAFNRKVTVGDLLRREREVVQTHQTLAGQNIARHGIELFQGSASLVDAHTVRVAHEYGRTVTLDGEFILIATGSRPHRPGNVAFDDEVVFDSDGILRLPRIPASLIIIGAGVIGCEYATLFAALGIGVTLVDNDDRFLPFLDEEIGALLMERMRALGVTLLFDRQVSDVRQDGDGKGAVSFAGGERLTAEAVLFCAGRSGNVEGLGLEGVGVGVGPRGCIDAGEGYRTSVANIFAAGDVIGPPALASTSMEQARDAVAHAFGRSYEIESAGLTPCAVYTIPEAALVGPTEQELRQQGRQYAVGRAWYRLNARAQILGDDTGLLKLIFDPNSRRLLAAHVIGEQAAELIHIGQACLRFQGTIDFFAGNIYNFPTLSELYRAAAHDGLARLGGGASAAND